MDTGSCIVVTGTGRGIGAAIARRLLEDGHPVIGVSLETHHAVDVPEGSSFEAITADVTVAADCERVRDAAVRYPGVAALVNNAGRHPTHAHLGQMGDDAIARLFELNVFSAMRMSRILLPSLRASRGAIVNIGSVAGMHGQDGSAAYAATKGALAAFTKALAIDEGSAGVRVNCVSPGAIASPATDREHDEATRRRIARWGVLGRLGTPPEVASVVAFLIGDGATYITGEEIAVSGGTHLGYGPRDSTTEREP